MPSCSENGAKFASPRQTSLESRLAHLDVPFRTWSSRSLNQIARQRARSLHASMLSTRQRAQVNAPIARSQRLRNCIAAPRSIQRQRIQSRQPKRRRRFHAPGHQRRSTSATNPASAAPCILRAAPQLRQQAQPGFPQQIRPPLPAPRIAPSTASGQLPHKPQPCRTFANFVFQNAQRFVERSHQKIHHAFPHRLLLCIHMVAAASEAAPAMLPATTSARPVASSSPA